MEKQKQNKSKTVYKCDSKHCTANGYHSKDDLVTVTLKLVIGKDCPLDFEEAAQQTVREAIVEAKKEVTPVASNIPGTDAVGPAAKMKKQTIVPPAFRNVMAPPPGMKLS